MEMREMGQGITDVISLCSQTEISAPGSASPFRRHRETVSSSTAFHHQVSLCHEVFAMQRYRSDASRTRIGSVWRGDNCFSSRAPWLAVSA
jgi:hypothetical protein